MILADEGLNGNLVKDLREDGYEIAWIKETKPGMDDEDIISLARRNSQILITEYKDFGEWIFAHHLSGLTIIFLRYDKEDYNRILAFLKTHQRSPNLFLSGSGNLGYQVDFFTVPVLLLIGFVKKFLRKNRLN